MLKRDVLVVVFMVTVLLLLSPRADSSVVSSGLVFEQNAANPGSQPNSYWDPTVGSGSGQLIGTPDRMVDYNPDGTQDWYYRFDSAGADNDQAVDIGSYSDMSFVDDDWCTVEAWVRLDQIIPNSKARGVIIGNVDGADTGWRLGLRCSASAGKYSVEFQQRDNETAQTAFTGSLYYNSGYTLDYSSTEWVHIAFVKYAAEYTDAGKISVNHDIYVNGQKLTHGVSILAADSLSDFYFTPRAPQLSTYRDDIYYDGDIGVVRVYDRLLTQAEVLQNYDAGFSVVPEPATLALLGVGAMSLIGKRRK